MRVRAAQLLPAELQRERGTDQLLETVPARGPLPAAGWSVTSVLLGTEGAPITHFTGNGELWAARGRWHVAYSTLAGRCH